MFAYLKKIDPTLFKLVSAEISKQRNTIDLIASENDAPLGVLELLGSQLTNKYSEGYPGKRYYPGNTHIDDVETLAQRRSLSLFSLSSTQWHSNVQAYSGAIANLSIYLSVLKPGDKILSMDLTAGGHLSHGSRASFSGKLFDVYHYGVNEKYDIDYLNLEKLALKIKPKMIVSGASAFCKKINFKKIGGIAKKVGAWHLADISHYAGLIVGGVYPSPFDYADFVMSTTHKSLFGPRSAVIYVNKKSILAKNSQIVLENVLDRAIFPGLQGGPHNNVIGAMAHGFFLAAHSKAKKYYKQALINSISFSKEMKKFGFEIVGGETHSHMFLVRTARFGLNGYEAEKKLEAIGVLANRNTILGDASALKPSAIRIGTYAVTARGMKEKEMKKLAKILYERLAGTRDVSDLQKDVKALAARF